MFTASFSVISLMNINIERQFCFRQTTSLSIFSWSTSGLSFADFRVKQLFEFLGPVYASEQPFLKQFRRYNMYRQNEM
jgi:hypothetical protein